MPKNPELTALKHYTEWMSRLIHDLPWLALVLGVMILIAMALRIALRLWDWRQILRQKYVFIEITPPITADITPLQSTKWITRLHSIGSRTAQENYTALTVFILPRVTIYPARGHQVYRPGAGARSRPNEAVYPLSPQRCSYTYCRRLLTYWPQL